MSRSESLQTTLLAAALLAAGCFAWWLQLRPGLEVDASQLASVPTRIDVFGSVDIPLEETVEANLRADFNLQRVYVSPVGGSIEVYIGYYGTERGGRPEHTPWACYPSAGWTILERDRIWIDRERGLRANDLVVENNGKRYLVLFWYRSFRATGLLGPVDQILDRLIGRLLESRSDGALMRISTPIRGGDVDAARARLVAFASELDRLVEGRWPVERPSSDGRQN